MKLWLLTQNEIKGYDAFDAAVVAAETEEQARGTHPGGPNFKFQSDYVACWASSPGKVTTKCIGVATEGTEAGVILASFNAG